MTMGLHHNKDLLLGTINSAATTALIDITSLMYVGDVWLFKIYIYMYIFIYYTHLHNYESCVMFSENIKNCNVLLSMNFRSANYTQTFIYTDKLILRNNTITAKNISYLN